METKTLIQSQANVLKITSLSAGNVVKIISTQYSSPEILYGVVTDLFNTGEKTFVEILQYTKSYNSVSAEIKLYDGKNDLNIFPATAEEVEEHLTSAVKNMEERIAEEKKDLQRKIEALDKVKSFVSGEMSKKLLDTSFIEITQEEYNKKIEEKNKLIQESTVF